MKNNILKCGLIAISIFAMCGCKKIESTVKDWESATAGLDRIIKIYPYGSSKPIATYEGDIDLSEDGSGR